MTANDSTDGLVETDELIGRRDDALLTAILQGASNRQAAEASGYSEATVARRMREPRFRARIKGGRQALQERTLTALHAAGTVGVRTLLEAAAGVPPSVEQHLDAEGNVVRVVNLGVPWAQRVSAARALVELGVGSLARIVVDIDAPDPGVIQDAEDMLTRKLEQYEEALPAGLRIVDSTSTESANSVADPRAETGGATAKRAKAQVAPKRTRRRA